MNMVIENSNFLSENNLNLSTTDTNKANVHTQAANEHEAGHGESAGGPMSPSDIFPTMFKSGMGDHHELTFFHYKIADLPVILYDASNGLKVYSSLETMKEAGIYTQNHETHKIVKVLNPAESPSFDLSITSLVCFQWLSLFIIIACLLFVRRKYKKNPGKEPKGLQNLVEYGIDMVRDKIVRPNISNKKVADKLLPYFLALYVFILVMNLIGLLPGGHTATGAIGTTAALALTALLVINISAITQIGIGNWFKHLLGGAPWWLSFIMVPIEILSLFTKPFALTIRLFANMTAGHVVLLSLVGLIFYFKSLVIAPISIGFSIFMYLLETLVALLQAYIFTILTAVFTGLAVGDHGDEHSH